MPPIEHENVERLIDSGDYEGAVRLLRELVVSDPTDRFAVGNLAVAGDLANVQTWHDAVAAHPHAIQARWALAASLAVEHRRAVDCLSAALTLADSPELAVKTRLRRFGRATRVPDNALIVEDFTVLWMSLLPVTAVRLRSAMLKAISRIEHAAAAGALRALHENADLPSDVRAFLAAKSRELELLEQCLSPSSLTLTSG